MTFHEHLRIGRLILTIIPTLQNKLAIIFISSNNKLKEQMNHCVISSASRDIIKTFYFASRS